MCLSIHPPPRGGTGGRKASLSGWAGVGGWVERERGCAFFPCTGQALARKRIKGACVCNLRRFRLQARQNKAALKTPSYKKSEAIAPASPHSTSAFENARTGVAWALRPLPEALPQVALGTTYPGRPHKGAWEAGCSLGLA